MAVFIAHGTGFRCAPLSPDERRAARAELGIGADGPVILTVARLEAEKGHATIVDALPQIRRAFPAAQFVWAGSGALRGRLEQQIVACGASDQVHLLGQRSDIGRLLAMADVFVLPAPAEPFGLAVLEAMAAGLPVIAVNAGGPAEIVAPGVTGLLIAPHATALAEAVCALLSDPERARRMGAAGQARCFAEYTVERMVRQTEALYAELVQASGRRRVARREA